MANVRINGEDRALDGPGDTSLLWGIRDLAGLTGTKYGCGTGLCGACTVLVDGVSVRACQATLEEVAGKEVTTIEGLDSDGNHPVQVAWRQANVPQCGFCQAGQIMPGREPAERDTEPDRRADPRKHGGQHLSMRLLRADRGGGAARGDGSMNHVAHD